MDLTRRCMRALAAPATGATRRARGHIGSLLSLVAAAVVQLLGRLVDRLRSAERQRARVQSRFESGLRDVTSELTPADVLRASEERHRWLVENLPAVVYYAPPGYVRGEAPLWFISPRIETWLGYPVTAWVSNPQQLRSIIHPEDRAGVLEETIAAARQGVSRRSEFRMFDRDGVEHWVLDQTHTVPGPDDEPGWLHGVLIEITEQKRNEQQLAERAEIQRALASRLQGLVNASPLPIVTAAADGAIIEYNHAAERILGIGDDDLGVQLPERLPDIGPALGQLIRAATEGRMPPPMEVTTTSTGRGEQILQLHVGPRSVRPDELDAVVFFVDVTERRMLEDHLSQVDRMEALGRLAGGIAHDFNNLLTVIRTYADLARTGDSSPSVQQDLDGIVEATTEGAELVRLFLGAPGSEDEEVDPVDLAAAIARDRDFYERALPPHVSLGVDTPPGTAAVSITVSDLRRMLLNLIANAADALGDQGGEVDVLLAGDGETVRLSVRDEGAGMDQTTVSRVFEPFFTTKGEAGGTGLGLFTVHRLAQAYGGRVEIDSTLGAGTQITLAFPASRSADDGPDQPGDEQPSRADVSRAGRILVVEDDDRVRPLTSRILVDAGYEVEAVGTGEAAMAVLESHTFALLVSDVVLPGIDGTAVADVARRLQPGIAVILMSGFASTVAMSRGVGVGEFGLLAKPFSSQRLLGRVEDALGAAL